MEFNCFKNYTDDILPLSGKADLRSGSLENQSIRQYGDWRSQEGKEERDAQ